ncbi:Galactose/methyl galactoside import ATP-binding protein MglA [Austwickia sp. TVS 96-490-7B]|uniref:sugar ABC transporter ATP-binding protein n=1 Tax=Austwickia sp. TVS 96-490-7B TaxID=2830843 RepID=UPI001D1B27B3|nr:sugar ABC transporter ATP-binding protein [Austwickia sp. TVS 96-490-7B]MBW3084724.1 Galactose/methyl galactoside import ATP-binding protein MglA [Austwickia sp. TVS 96-490-7B]
MTIETPPGTPIVRAVDVSKRFGGVVALRDVSVDFYPGEVHCIAGENGCGKSTLIKVISGAHRPTSGHIDVDGRSYDRLTPAQAYGLGLEVIYQDFSLMPNLDAAENIALPGFVAGRRRFVRRQHILEIAEKAVSQLGIDLDLRRPVGELTVAERQLCAVARAMAHDARFIAMDEPTTALTWKEVDALFDAVRTLRDRGVSLVFISHKMQEVFSISDRVTVMRSGQVVTTGRPADFTHATLAETMTGRSSDELVRPSPVDTDRPAALAVRGLTHAPLFADVDLTIHQGEIVGLAGLLGSGRTEIAEAIAAINPAPQGTVEVHGSPVAARHLTEAIDAGIGYVPEDRLTQGLFLDQSIADNLVATHLDAHTRHGLLDTDSLDTARVDAVRDLRIKAGSLDDPVRSLSGGNAQRVLLAKWLMGHPKVLILNGPTVGVDVGSKFDILSILHLQSLQGLGILVISDDIPELVATCHRVLVVRSGRIVDELAGERLTETAIVEAISA